MTCRLEILHDLRHAGIAISLDSGDIVLRPAGRLDSNDLAVIRAAKPDLLRILAGPTDDCPHCGGHVVRDLTSDGFWNRFCVECGRWLRCLPPPGTESVQTADQPSTEQRRLLCNQDPS